MTYKTVTLQLYKPGRGKQEILDYAIARYTLALQILLDFHREAVESALQMNPEPRGADLSALLDKSVLKKLNILHIEPFKDSLKMEWTAILHTYVASRQKKPHAQYPQVLRTDSGAYNCILDSFRTDDPDTSGELLSDLLKTICKEDEQHPLYFGRYSPKRDFCLLFDENTHRFYTKLYLLNDHNRIEGSAGNGKVQLQYLTADASEAVPKSVERRFLVCPLAFGKHQLADLERLLGDPRKIKTARLQKIGKQYYLLVSVVCDAPALPKSGYTMGIARGTGGGIHYTVCDPSGAVMETGQIQKDAQPDQKLFVYTKEILEVCRKYTAQLIAEKDGGRNDQTKHHALPDTSVLTTTEYARLVQIIRYKLPGEGLPPPVHVSGNRLYHTCPDCGTVTGKSCITPRLFICVACGYASAVESIGSLNLVRKIKKYKTDTVPFLVRTEGEYILFSNQILGFACYLPKESPDFSQMYYELTLFINGQSSMKTEPKKYAILQKLRKSTNITESVRLISAERD